MFSAFAAYEENVPVDSDKEHLERTLLKEYQCTTYWR